MNGAFVVNTGSFASSWRRLTAKKTEGGDCPTFRLAKTNYR
jgi:hypothetical protein